MSVWTEVTLPCAGDVAHLKFVAVTEMGGGGMRKFEKQLDVDVSMNDTRDRQ